MIRKNDIIKTLAKDLKITQVLADKIVDNIVDQIKKELLIGNDVIIKELFTLSVKEFMGRTVINPATGITSEAKPYKKVRCSFSRKLRDQIKAS